MPSEANSAVSPAACRVAQALAACPLYFLLDTQMLAGRTPEEIAGTAIDNGVRMIQLRCKTMDHGELLSLASRLKAAIADRALLIVNDHPDIAVRAGADGVHVGVEDTPVAEVLSLSGQLIAGVSAQTPEAAVRAEIDGASYLGSGAVFASPTKPQRYVIGLQGLHKVARAVSIPVVGIGGITRANCSEVMAAGAAGFCSISDLTEANGLSGSIREFCLAAGCSGIREDEQ